MTDPAAAGFEYWQFWDGLADPAGLLRIAAPAESAGSAAPAATPLDVFRADLRRDRLRALRAARTLTGQGEPAAALRARINAELASFYLGEPADPVGTPAGLAAAAAEAGRLGARWEEGYSAFASAAVHRRMSAPDTAADLLATAARIFDDCGDQCAYGYARLAMARLAAGDSGRAGRAAKEGPGRAAARVHLLAGLDAFRAAGAHGGLLNALWMLSALEPGEPGEPVPAGAATLTALTRREREVAGLLGSGLTNRQIAARMNVAERTVDTHVQRILAKLNLSTRVQVAVLVAVGGPTDTAG